MGPVCLNARAGLECQTTTGLVVGKYTASPFYSYSSEDIKRQINLTSFSPAVRGSKPRSPIGRAGLITNVGALIEKNFVEPTHRIKMKSQMTMYCSIFVT